MRCGKAGVSSQDMARHNLTERVFRFYISATPLVVRTISSLLRRKLVNSSIILNCCGKMCPTSTDHLSNVVAAQSEKLLRLTHALWTPTPVKPLHPLQASPSNPVRPPQLKHPLSRRLNQLSHHLRRRLRMCSSLLERRPRKPIRHTCRLAAKWALQLQH